MRRLLAVAGLLASFGTALAGGAVGVRSGAHAGFGRIVLDLPPGSTAVATQSGAAVQVRVDPPADVGAPAGPVPNLRHVEAHDGGLVLTLSPGAQLRSTRLGSRLVLDLLDPAAPAAATPPSPVLPRPRTAMRASSGLVPIDRHSDAPAAVVTPAPAAPSVRPPPAPAEGPNPVAAAPVVAVAQAALAPAGATAPSVPPPMPSAVASAPMQLAARPVAVPAGSSGHAASLPFDAGVGAAAFRRGDAAVVVFDQRRPIDLAPLQGDPLLAGAAVQLLPAATVLRMMLPADQVLRLARTPAGWTLTALPAAAAAGPPDLVPELAGGVLRLPTTAAGQVISVPDPQSGATLLVGTMLSGPAAAPPPAAVAVARRTPEFALLKTWQGVAVEPLSDAVVVRVVQPGPVPAPPRPGQPAPEAPPPVAPGFLVEAGGGRALALDAPPSELPGAGVPGVGVPGAGVLGGTAAAFTRRFDFPAETPPELRRREAAAVAAAGAAPAQARTGKRIGVAAAMVSLGLGAEAQAVLALAAGADGRQPQNPDLPALNAVAALVAGRPEEAAALDDPGLSGSDEVALWRAVRLASMHEAAPEAAAVFAADLPLLLAYPAPLRAHLLPLAAETMAGAGNPGATALLAARPDDHALDLARGIDLERRDPAAALALYDRLAQGEDRLLRARAAARAIELRLAGGAVTPGQAADGLERLLYSWRGDARELALRQRVVALRRQSGGFRHALALLRETDALWPDQHAAVQASLAATFAEAVAEDAPHPPSALDLVSLAAENPDLMPGGAAGLALAARLADRLAALELPRRAMPVLERLAQDSSTAPVRAAFGDRLATMRLAQGDAAGAIAALAASAAADLPPELAQSRVLTFARASVAVGQTGRALASLEALGTPQAQALRTGLLEAAHDWPAAAAALRAQAAQEIPSDGPLDDTQARLLLRLASAAAQSGDEQVLAALRERDLPRLPPGATAETLRLLTERPVLDTADLPRAARETQLARALPATLRTSRR